MACICLASRVPIERDVLEDMKGAYPATELAYALFTKPSQSRG